MRLFKRGKVFFVEIERNKKKSLGTSDQAQAERLFAKIQKAYLEKKIILLDKSERITLSEFTTRYIESRYDLSKKTLQMDRTALSSLADSIGGDTPLRLIDLEKIEAFKRDCIARGAQKKSVNSYLRHIRAAFNTAIAHGHIKQAPPIKNFKTKEVLPRTLTRDEIQILLQKAQDTMPDMHRIITFALWTGCRRDEIKRLRWQNYNNETHVATITGKGNKERIVPILDPALDAMGKSKDIGYVFPQWHLDTYTHRFKAVAISCGITDIHFHNLRHTSATMMVESGIKLEIIQKILGHSDISTTQIYAQIYDQVVRSEMKKLTL